MKRLPLSRMAIGVPGALAGGPPGTTISAYAVNVVAGIP